MDQPTQRQERQDPVSQWDRAWAGVSLSVRTCATIKACAQLLGFATIEHVTGRVETLLICTYVIQDLGEMGKDWEMPKALDDKVCSYVTDLGFFLLNTNLVPLGEAREWIKQIASAAWFLCLWNSMKEHWKAESWEKRIGSKLDFVHNALYELGAAPTLNSVVGLAAGAIGIKKYWNELQS